MTIRRFCALATVAMLVLLIAACGGSGGKKTATSTPKKTSAVTRTVTPRATGASNATPDAPTSSNGTGGGGNGNSTPGDTGSAQPTVPRITGNTTAYRVEFTVASDPNHLQQLIESRARPTTHLTITVGNGQILIDAPQPFLKVTGTVDASGNFTANGNGKVDPYSGVDVTFTGSITAAGQITGTYTYGSNGALPGGQPISYSVTGTTTIPRTPGA
jgi:hypothetical protein